jgi:hypothetical protein
MDFSLVCYLKTLPTLAGQGENEMTNKKATQNGVAVFFILLFSCSWVWIVNAKISVKD